jgi:anti-sigma B factor antagonist
MSLEHLHNGATAEILAVGASRNGGEYIIELAGELDLSGVTRVSEAFASALDSDARAIVLDLRALEFLDSTGVHSIITAERLAAERDMSFVIIRGPRQVQRILEIAGIAERLTFSDG